jgi:hypothetical protein
LLESYGFEITGAGPLNEQFLAGLESTGHKLLLVDRYEDTEPLSTPLRHRLEHWPAPVLFNDSMATRLSLRQGNPEFGRLLVEQISTLLTPNHT